MGQFRSAATCRGPVTCSLLLHGANPPRRDSASNWVCCCASRFVDRSIFTAASGNGARWSFARIICPPRIGKNNAPQRFRDAPLSGRRGFQFLLGWKIFFSICSAGQDQAFVAVRGLIEWTDLLKQRIAQLARLHGPAAQLSFLEQAAPWPDRPPNEWHRPLRVGIVQSVIPNMEDYGQHLNDPELLADPLFEHPSGVIWLP